MIRSIAVLLLLSACADSGGDSDVPLCGNMLPGASFSGAGGSVLTIVATNPSPPARFTNWWAITIDDRDGAPMIDAAALRVSAVMPEHGHGAPTAPTVTSEADGLVVGPLELWMPGLWEVRFDVDGDRIVVPVCIDE